MSTRRAAEMAHAVGALKLPSCGWIEINSESIVVDVNDTLLVWLGCARADIVNQQIEAVLTVRMPVTGNDGVRPTDATLRSTSGAARPVVLGLLDTDEFGTQRIAIYDVSTRSAFTAGFRNAEAKTERGRQRIQILLNSAIGFVNVRTEHEAAELLVDVAQRSFTASSVSVHLAKSDGLVQVAGTNPLADNWPPDVKPTGVRTLLGGEVIVVRTSTDADAYLPGADLSAVFRSSGIHAAIASPIKTQGESIGSVICYFNHPREFDEEAVPLAEALSNQAAQAIKRIRQEDALRRAAMHDDLTGLPTRRLVEEDVTRTLLTQHTTLSVIFIDLDGFKAVNDLLGHITGDRLLREVGRRLRASIRETDVLGRFGGDEFVVVAGIDDVKDATLIAERIRCAVAQPYDELPEKAPITASVGVVAIRSSDFPVMDHLIRAADHAMYQAKMSGGDRVTVTDLVGSERSSPPAGAR